MGFDYSGLRDSVVEPSISFFGKTAGDAYLILPGLDTGPAYKPERGTPTNVTVDAVQTSFKKDTNRGTLVEKTDVLFIVSTKNVTADPTLADKIHVEGIQYEVVRVDPLRTGPTTMFWYIHARK
jgi:hypothetical protein